MVRPPAFLLRAAHTAFREERSSERGVKASRNTMGYTSGALKYRQTTVPYKVY